jgi:hypothetical protein
MDCARACTGAWLCGHLRWKRIATAGDKDELAYGIASLLCRACQRLLIAQPSEGRSASMAERL